MASLAPGNGWYPEPVRPSRRSRSSARAVPADRIGNVYVFPSSALHIEGVAKASRRTNHLIAWCITSAVVLSLLWLGLASVLVSAALMAGMPLATVTAAAVVAHLLGAGLAITMGVRIVRRLLATEDRQPRKLPER